MHSRIMGRTSCRIFCSLLLIVLSSLWLLAYTTVTHAQSATLTVCPAGTPGRDGCDYIGGDGIQSAIEAAPVGSGSEKTTIVIKDGNYSRQNYSQFDPLPWQNAQGDQFKRKCFINTLGKNIAVVGSSQNAILDGRQSSAMSGICARNGEIEIRNLTISEFDKIENESLCTSGPCSRAYGIDLDDHTVATIESVTVKGYANVGITTGNENTKTRISSVTIDGGARGLYGLYANDHAIVHIQDSIVTNNSLYGIYLNHFAEAEIFNNKMTNSGVYAVKMMKSSHARMLSNTIQANNSGIWLKQTSFASIEKNTIQENKGFGITIQGDAHANIVANIIRNNNEGISVSNVPSQNEILQGILSVEVNNNVINKNNGSGIKLYDVYDAQQTVPQKLTASIKNNTLVGNAIGIDALTDDNENTEIINNIMAFNLNTGMAAYDHATHQAFKRFEYNIYFGNTINYGAQNLHGFTVPIPSSNSEIDPLFIESKLPDYHLQPSSPARNTGDPAILNPNGTQSDIGAYGGPKACQLDPLLPGCTQPIQPSTTPPPNQPSISHLKGDINNDGKVDIFDYNIMITNFGQTNCGNPADVDGNCKVDIFDYNILISNFGK